MLHHGWRRRVAALVLAAIYRTCHPTRRPPVSAYGVLATEAGRVRRAAGRVPRPAGVRARGWASPNQSYERRTWWWRVGACAKKEQPICVLRGWAALVLAAIYFRGTCRPTIIDVPMFHFRVRDGTGWGHWAVTTRLRLVCCARGAACRPPVRGSCLSYVCGCAAQSGGS